MPSSVDLFRQHLNPGNPATFLIDASNGDAEAHSHSYGELAQAAAKLAALLAHKGVRRGDRLAIMLPNGREFLLLYLACLHAGITAVPINPALPARDTDYILSITRPALLIGEPGSGRTSAELPFWALASNSLWQQLETFSPAPATLEGDDIAAIFFTSGTTSRPKGVCHTATALLANAAAFNRHMQWDASLRMLHVLPMSYMAGFLNTLLCPLMAGGSLVLAPQFDAATALRFWQPVQQHGVNALWLTPTMLALLCKLNRDPDITAWTSQHLRSVCVGTAPLPASVRQAFEKSFRAPVHESYGMTEILLTSGTSPAGPQAKGSVGTLLARVEAQLRATDQQGEQGELWIKSDYALAGYLDPETGQLSSPLEQGWMNTGDLARIDEQGRLFITGRKKDLIIHGGHNVSPHAVEEVLRQHPSVDDVAVIGVPHPFHGEAIVALLILKPAASAAAVIEQLRQHGQQALPPHARPQHYEARPDFPRSVTGKIQKHQLRQQWLDAHPGHGS